MFVNFRKMGYLAQEEIVNNSLSVLIRRYGLANFTRIESKNFSTSLRKRSGLDGIRIRYHTRPNMRG
jgi:hypothetical protein